MGRLRELGVRDVPSVAATRQVGDALRDLTTRRFDHGADVVVMEDGRPLGVVPLERLVTAPRDAVVGQLVEEPVASIRADADQEHAAALAARLGTRVVVLLERDGRFAGLLTPERLIQILVHEHEEDLARLGGSLAGSSAAMRASVEPIPQRLWHRLPWLALGLTGAMLSAAIVASFEEQLRDEVLLAFFVPAVVYMADAVGTQTETVVIRGMSLGVPIARVAVRELVTGLVIGVLVAVSFYGFALAFWDEPRVAAVVALSLLLSTSLATAVAMVLPYLLARVGRDPAFGSGPLATVVQDLLSIAAYFAIAVALLG